MKEKGEKKEVEVRKKMRPRNIILIILLVIVIMFAMVYIDVYFRARSSFADGEKALQKKDYTKAVAWYGSTLQFYLPIYPYGKESKDRLMEIGQMYEKEGNYRLAKEAYGEIYHSIMAIRSFYTPYPEWAKMAEKKEKEMEKKETE